jgi:phospholipid/cholesterol/gamma-HCH transport system substrate-binding protein
MMAISEANTLLKEINNGTGTLGKLAVSDSLYNNLNNSTESLNKLLIDLKENPKNYVQFSLFGGKDKDE